MEKQQVKLSVRLDLPGGDRFGPGKAQLLEAIEATGSISGAARMLTMSYPRALRLVNEMNLQFKLPLVQKFQGGAKRGGASITEDGLTVLQLYRRVVENASKRSAEDLRKLGSMSKV